MAKTRQIAKNKANIATTEAKTTIPLRTMNGKVQKVKNTKKPLKTNRETNKENSIESKNQTVSPKTRLCCVKLRRCSCNTNINNNNTLRAQCKVNNKNEKMNKEIEMKAGSVDETSKKVDNVVEKAKTTNTKEIENANAFINKTKNNSKSKTNNEASEKALGVDGNNETNRSQITEKSLKRTDLVKSRQGKEQPKAEHVKNKRAAPKTKCNIEKPSTPRTSKRCAVKLQKTPITLKPKDIAIEPSTPSTIRNCLVKLKRNKFVAKTRDIEIVPTTPSTSGSACLVKLQRLPILQTNNADCAHTETLTSNYLSTIPVIDKSKRDNFRKLSLTKSLRKSSENKEKDSEINSNLKDSQQKKNLRSKTKEIPNNNNTEALTTNNLKANKCIKDVAKLSLKKQNVKNNKNLTTNLEVTQFEPQLHSAICFDPSGNSTLLDLGFTKDNIKEISKEKPKEDKSSKDKSSSQNLANKSEEIEKLLNSLDEDDEILLKSPDKENENEEGKNDESQYENDNNLETQTNILSSNNRSKMLTLPQDPKTKAVNIVETQNNVLSSKKQTNKFFHRKKEENQGNMLKDVPDPKTTSTTPSKAIQVTKKRRFLTKRSTMGKRDNVYEFLSQSQTSDSDGISKHGDATADIIKKLIDQGKVRVATNCKGKGKPKFKRNVPSKQMKKIKQKNKQADKKLKQLKNKKSKATAAKVHEIIDEEVEVENIDDFENYESTPDDYDIEYERPEVATEKSSNHKNINQSNDQEGTFSRLARTVLINEAGRSDLQRKNASLLLEKVRKYVSTPNNKQKPTTQTVLEANFSPILMPPLRTATIASPWRVNEDAYLPRTFNFARSSGNLPSFSSDFIPPTPTKKKPKNRVIMQEQTSITSNRSHVIGNQNSVPSLTPLQSPLRNAIENIEPNINEPSVLSSFSSNDSNAENMPPPRPTLENNNENENIFDLKQLPNPRRAHNYRSPLKAINILEVVHLPPYKKQQSEAVKMFGFEENLAEESLQTDINIEPINVTQQAVNNKKPKNHSKENLFGFEDFLSETEFSSQEYDGTNINETTTNEQSQIIHDKLQNLRKFKPPENELQLSLLKDHTSNALKELPLFDGDSAKTDGMRQRGIKEMLCSTLINPEPSTSREALRQLKNTNWKYSERTNIDISELFNDPDPETTFNEYDAHRTYIRPYKRKRRLKQNKYVMFLDSDASDDEHNSGEQRKHEDSHETDTSSEKVPKKKRQRKEPKEKPELTEFVEEFNDMCKEVESYELIVEKSA